MKLPFSTEDFLSVFENYNISVFPAQIIFNLTAISLIIIIFLKIDRSGKFAGIMLAALWIWMGAVYHILFFSAINKAAYFFGVLFITQAVLFFYEGVIKNKLSFEFGKNIYSLTGLVTIIYALILYPLLGYFSGHVYPKAPSFGLPCPTVIFTFGIFLLSTSKVRLYILVIPFIWSVIGVMAAFNLGIKEDIGLLAAGIIATSLSAIHNAKYKTENSGNKKIETKYYE